MPLLVAGGPSAKPDDRCSIFLKKIEEILSLLTLSLFQGVHTKRSMTPLVQGDHQMSEMKDFLFQSFNSVVFTALRTR